MKNTTFLGSYSIPKYDGKIYTVCTMYIEDGKIIRDRTPGWFSNVAQAVKCIKENWGDIYEHGYYNYALIEEVCEGLYSFGKRKDKWFYVLPIVVEGQNSFDYDVKEIDKPKEFKNVIGFSMG